VVSERRGGPSCRLERERGGGGSARGWAGRGSGPSKGGKLGRALSRGWEAGCGGNGWASATGLGREQVSFLPFSFLFFTFPKHFLKELLSINK